MSGEWTDRIAGERLTVDREFDERVRESPFTRQEWGLIMTAVEFEIERPDDPEQARLVANTDSLPAVMPELASIRRQYESVGGPTDADSTRNGGVITRVKRILGIGSGSDRERTAAAEALATEYATELQHLLEERGRWEAICARATSGSS